MSKILTDHGFLPLSSLRLIVPPLQLVSAALWEIVRQGAVMYYGLLEDFVTTVLETVPELLTYTERVQLVMGLRAKVVLELCRNDDFASPQAIQPHLNRINTYITNQDKETSSSEVKASVTNFLKLVHTLVDDQCQRDIFYQKIFPTVFGPKYDSALHSLMRKFLFNLQKLLPVPNLEQTSLWLSLSPSILKECVDFMNQPEPLNTLIQHHKHHGHKVPQALSSSGDDCILSSLSYHLPNVDNDEGDTLVKPAPMCVSQDWQRDNLLGSEPKKDKEENFKESSELMRSGERNGQQHVDDDNDDCSLVCHVCGKVFTYSKNFDKHQKICVVSGKRQAETDPQCSTSLAHHSKPNPVEKTKESLPSETETKPSNVVPQESTSSDSPQEQTCKRSGRVKQCSVCGKIFTCSTDLTRHMRCHTEESPCLCSYCGKDFDNYEDCETHQEDKCRVSNPQSWDNSSSNANKRDRENTVVSSSIAQIPAITEAPANSQAMQACKSPLTCQECGQGFTYYKSFEKHQSKCAKRAPRRKKRTNTNHFVINACNVRSADNTNGNHAETSSETKASEAAKTPASTDRAHGSQAISRTIKCTMCEKNFSEIVLMKRHYSKSHKVRGSYPCPVCKRTFVRLCELVRHLQNKKLYQCATCKKCYTKPGLLNDHENVHTASVTPRVCETCGKSLKSLAYLILHQSKHRERQPSVCSYCGKQFSTKGCLKAHMVRHTGGYPCPVCGKKFYQKTYLKWHLYKHTGQEPYLCDTCGKGWPSAAQLKLHMIQHTEERPFKCEDCSACYKRGSHLMAHRRAKHIRLRPFVCEVCSKAFRLNSELKKHMMVHTGERPFTCPRCGKTFTRKSRLREHSEKACL